MCEAVVPQEADLRCPRLCLAEERVDISSNLCRNYIGSFQFSRQVGQVYGPPALLEKRGDVSDERHEVRVRIESKELAEIIYRVDYRGARIRAPKVEPDIEKNPGWMTL